MQAEQPLGGAYNCSLGCTMLEPDIHKGHELAQHPLAN